MKSAMHNNFDGHAAAPSAGKAQPGVGRPGVRRQRRAGCLRRRLRSRGVAEVVWERGALVMPASASSVLASIAESSPASVRVLVPERLLTPAAFTTQRSSRAMPMSCERKRVRHPRLCSRHQKGVNARWRECPGNRGEVALNSCWTKPFARDSRERTTSALIELSFRSRQRHELNTNIAS